MFYVKKYSNKPIIFEDDWIKDKIDDTINTLDIPKKPIKEKIKDQLKNEKHPLTNIGFINNDIIIEIDLAGYKKENISVSYTGNVISVNAKHSANSEYPSEVFYLRKNIHSEDISEKFYLQDGFIDADVKWKLIDGILCIVIRKLDSQNNSSIEESAELYENNGD